MKELPDYPADFFVNKKSKANLENAPQMLQAAIPVLEALPDWNVTAIHDSLIALAGELGVKNGTLLCRCASPRREPWSLPAGRWRS